MIKQCFDISNVNSKDLTMYSCYVAAIEASLAFGNNYSEETY